MMKAIVKFFRRRAIKSFLKRKKQCILPDIKKYPSVAILLDEDQFSRHKDIEKLMANLFDLKRLTIIAYVNTLPKDVLQSDRHFFIQKGDFDFWGLMKQAKKESLISLSFDMMIDFARNDDDIYTKKYIISLINNTFRVAFGHRCTKFYDMVIDSKNDEDMLNRIEILKNYLSMLLGQR